MNLLRLSIIAVSAALTFSVGSSASTANTSYSHPEFSVTENRTLNLRETGSQIVVETIENALRAGGLALLGEGFQLDSSLSYHSGDNEGIEGDLDVVIPLWNGGRHVVFAQPGAVFWTGLTEEERIDANIGLVYRAELVRDLVAGASVFYDHDFQIGHSRVSGGIDLQSGFFRLGANYYHVLSEVEDGREGFVEEAVDGMDARLVFERDVVRLGGTVGYWDYEGEESSGGEDSQSGWKTSIGLDAGVRILPGVFAEASWERHKDELVLDERIFAGLAFKFSLPNFEGASYGDGSMSANLYKIVDREKRILYEERVAGPTVSIVRTGNEAIPADEEVTVAVDIRLSEALTENVTINLVGSGPATYNDDYTVSVDGTDCPMVTEDNCQVTIIAGQLSPSGDVVIAIIDDGRNNEPAEDIILSMVIASPANTDLLPRGSVALTIPADLPPPPLPTVSLSADSTSITEGNTATITLTLSEALTGDATFNLISGGKEATYGASSDWNLSVGGTDCADATESSPCQVTITQGGTTAEVIVEVNTDTIDETTPKNFTVSVAVDSGSISIVELGNSQSLNFTIPADLPTVSLNRSGTGNLVDSIAQRMIIRLNRALEDEITLYFVGGGTAAFGASGVWTFNYDVITGQTPPVTFNGTSTCNNVTRGACRITLPEGRTVVDISIVGFREGSGQSVIVSVEVPQESSNLVKPGDTTRHELTIQ